MQNSGDIVYCKTSTGGFFADGKTAVGTNFSAFLYWYLSTDTMEYNAVEDATRNTNLASADRARAGTNLPDVQGHDNLFQGRVARPLSDAVDRALHLAGQTYT